MSTSHNKGRQGFGLVQLFTGNGKGKTTAAIGEAVRAVGAGKRVAIIFFDKGGSHYSERAVFEQIGVKVVGTGRDRIEPSGRFDFSITEIDREEAVRGIREAEAAIVSEAFDLVILDEINSTTDLQMLDEKTVLDLLDRKPSSVEVVLTGRNAPQAFLDRADLVTEMTLHKHYFYTGTKAREGIDF